MIRYFKDDELDLEFKEKGYVKFKFLGVGAIADLLALYKKYKPFYIRHTFCNLYSLKPEKNVIITDRIYKHTQSLVKEMFPDFDLISGCFIAKGRGKNTTVDFHQDWSITDESQYYSLAIWIPLVDTTKENGALAIIPGSHKWPSAIRSYNMPSVYVGLNKVNKANYETLNLEAGEAVIYAQNIFHASWPNMSKGHRVSITLALLPKAAGKLFFYNDSKNGIGAFAMPADFQYNMISRLKKGIYPNALSKAEFIFDADKEPITEQKLFEYLNN